ncbi:putative quinol monooxygenase [Sulfitobacter sp. HNIBRBA2951]|uniref:putative quinol monooxygenase n=1 Tax=Sulfitobacter aquimarinus TaxID=3158557 RepID=UPI0032E048C7
MYVVSVTFEIAAGKMDAFLPLMMDQAQNSLAKEAQCHVFDVCTAGNTVLLYELYTDEAAFKAHLEMPHYAQFNTAIDGMIADKQVAFFERVAPTEG